MKKILFILFVLVGTVGYAQQLELPFGVKVNNRKPLNYYYYKDGITPYADTAEVNSTIPISVRYRGMTALVDTVEYWYMPDTLDISLKIKTSGGAGGISKAGNGLAIENSDSVVFSGQNIDIDFVSFRSELDSNNYVSFNPDFGEINIENNGDFLSITPQAISLNYNGNDIFNFSDIGGLSVKSNLRISDFVNSGFNTLTSYDPVGLTTTRLNLDATDFKTTTRIVVGNNQSGQNDNGQIFFNGEYKGRRSNINYDFPLTLNGNTANRGVYWSSGSILTQTPYTIPTTSGSVGQVLTMSASNVASWQTPSGGSSVLSDITAATGANTINSGANHQIWDWNSLTSGKGISFRSSSTDAASNTLQVVSVEKSGANSNSEQTTTALNVSNTGTGTTSTNIAGYFAASGGTTNISLHSFGETVLETTAANPNINLRSSSGADWLRFVNTRFLAFYQTVNSNLRITPSNTALGLEFMTPGANVNLGNRFAFTWSGAVTGTSAGTDILVVSGENQGGTKVGATLSSGTKNFGLFKASGAWNFTGTYSGTLIGYDYDPTLTSTTGLTNLSFRATSGNMLVPASSFVNFGTTSGSGGYGFQDDSGALKVKNSGGSYQNIIRGSTGSSNNAIIVADGTGGVTTKAVVGVTADAGVITASQYTFNNNTILGLSGYDNEPFISTTNGALLSIGGLLIPQDSTSTSWTLDETNRANGVLADNGSAITITVPSDLETGYVTTIMQAGAGTVTITEGSNVDIIGKTSTTGVGDFIWLWLYKKDGGTSYYVGR